MPICNYTRCTFLERLPQLSFFAVTDFMLVNSDMCLEVRFLIIFCSIYKFEMIVISYHAVLQHTSYRYRFIFGKTSLLLKLKCFIYPNG